MKEKLNELDECIAILDRSSANGRINSEQRDVLVQWLINNFANPHD